MSRLLFAAARGARIQRQHFKDPAWLVLAEALADEGL